MLPWYWAWLDLQEDLGLPPLSSKDVVWTRCSLDRSSVDRIELARLDLVVDDQRWSHVETITGDDGFEHWLWRGGRFASPARWAWSSLVQELGLPALPTR